MADYARSAERIVDIFARLERSPTYAQDVVLNEDPAAHAPRAETMEQVLDAIDAEYGGLPAWLRINGWSESDAGALRARLLS